MKYVPTTQLKEFIESVKRLPEQYRRNDFGDNAELTGRIAGLLFAVGVPAYIGWQIGGDISDYFELGQITKTGAQAAAGTSVSSIYVGGLGHTTVDKFGDWGRAIGEATTNIRNSLEGLVLRIKKPE